MAKRRDVILHGLTEVTKQLGDLADEFIFLGGSVVPILVSDEAAQDARVTTDVDVVVHVLTCTQYHDIEKRLAKVGFHLDMQSGILCRFKQGDMILDVMPTHEEILKFGNKWYKQAAENPISFPLTPQLTIKVINAPLFLCTKFTAYKDRGHLDQKDLEDIVAVVDGRRELLDELAFASSEIKQFVSESAKEVLDKGLASRLDWFLPADSAGKAREELVYQRLIRITNL